MYKYYIPELMYYSEHVSNSLFLKFHMLMIFLNVDSRCGRPNLNHVTECYKCGATLAPTANKWIYVGSHSGRGNYKQSSTCT